MNFSDRKYLPFLVLFIVVFVSRLPFLSAGFGVEEDSWGIVLAAAHTALTGTYEPSRFPGHPVHEFIYSAFPFHSALFYNLFSTFFSALATLFFALILQHLKFKHFIIAALALAFTPVFYISSTYTIDFVWTIAFILISFFCLLKEKFIFCGIFLGLAIGCRITSGAMFLPFLIIFWQKNNMRGNIKIALKVLIPLVIVSFISYLPLMIEFGASFFMYYDQFPYPSIAKVFYKMIPGVFGFLGVLAIGICLVWLFINRNKLSKGSMFENGLGLPTGQAGKKIILSSIVVIILFVISYFRLPQKSGYMITVIPFVIILFGYYLNSKLFNFLCCSLILSSFFCSINLTDTHRGATYSRLAVVFNVSGQELFFDPVSGPIFSDYSKRKIKIKYTDEVIEMAASISSKTVVIAGWWYNQIMVGLFPDNNTRNVIFESYIDEQKMKDYISKGYAIKYLPEQNIYNDQMFKMKSTDKLAAEF